MRSWPTRRADPAPPVITLLTDFGHADIYVGVLHGVIALLCPQARVIDLSHEVPPGDVLAGALALQDGLAFLPVGIHVAVIDPGVGSDRRPVALRTRDGRILVGPDNGVLSPAARSAGGVQAAVDLRDSPLALDPVSATFHGRDLFVAVAAGLAGPATLLTAGVPVDPEELCELSLPEPVPDGDGDGNGLTVTVTAVDRFGNLAVYARPDDLTPLGLAPGAVFCAWHGARRCFGRYGETFSDVGRGRLVLHRDSTGRMALAVNRGRADALLEAGAGAELRLVPVH
ncbi:S-adenosyl-l-methionine hydroxide adenosyltransferase family protein [Conexibacter sp. DBS9H8]|uniref:SAM hydrolase/SAM-dependent halogenase family protein n=1 Tax=Conexibacter sp. DBS9H8 TaxID=2937801 RepID=UPI00200FC579|nr:SAM-dependent chlorinase/fluorinase [Conexibacter sp. DBS9H8]